MSRSSADSDSELELSPQLDAEPGQDEERKLVEAPGVVAEQPAATVQPVPSAPAAPEPEPAVPAPARSPPPVNDAAAISAANENPPAFAPQSAAPQSAAPQSAAARSPPARNPLNLRPARLHPIPNANNNNNNSNNGQVANPRQAPLSALVSSVPPSVVEIAPVVERPAVAVSAFAASPTIALPPLAPNNPAVAWTPPVRSPAMGPPSSSPPPAYSSNADPHAARVAPAIDIAQDRNPHIVYAVPVGGPSSGSGGAPPPPPPPSGGTAAAFDSPPASPRMPLRSPSGHGPHGSSSSSSSSSPPPNRPPSASVHSPSSQQPPYFSRRLSSDPSSPAAVALSLCHLCSFRTPAVSHMRAQSDRLVCDECSGGLDDNGMRRQWQLPGQGQPIVSQAMLLPGGDPETIALITTAVDTSAQQLHAACAMRQMEVQHSFTALPSLEQTVHATLAPDEKMRFSLGVENFFFAQGGFAPHQAGLLLLTDQRLICLTQCRHASTTRNWESWTNNTAMAGDALRGHVRVSHSAGDSIWIFPIPHKNLKHLSLESDNRVQANNTVAASLFGPHLWCVLFGCVLILLGLVLLLMSQLSVHDDTLLALGIIGLIVGIVIAVCGLMNERRLFEKACCGNHYKVAVSPIQGPAVAQTHTLHIALLMPPWEEKQLLRVSVNPRVPLLKLHQFAAQFQSILAQFQDQGVKRIGPPPMISP